MNMWKFFQCKFSLRSWVTKATKVSHFSSFFILCHVWPKISHFLSKISGKLKRVPWPLPENWHGMALYQFLCYAFCHSYWRNKGSTMLQVPNHWGDITSPNNVAGTFFIIVHLLLKDFRFEHEGAKFVSWPGQHLTLVRPWSLWISYKVLELLSLLQCIAAHLQHGLPWVSKKS